MEKRVANVEPFKPIPPLESTITAPPYPLADQNVNPSVSAPADSRLLGQCETGDQQ